MPLIQPLSAASRTSDGAFELSISSLRKVLMLLDNAGKVTNPKG
jgi:hypothetical protein